MISLILLCIGLCFAGCLISMFVNANFHHTIRINGNFKIHTNNIGTFIGRFNPTQIDTDKLYNKEELLYTRTDSM